MKNFIPDHILLSRIDNLGDVILTLPLAGLLKKKYPSCKISFLGKSYTKPIILACSNIDFYIDIELLLELNKKDQVHEIKQRNIDTVIHVLPDLDIAKICYKAGIKTRIGTSHRLLHWLFCNTLVPLKRKKLTLT